ncbi:NPCBM/NEW2 domain-containing protein [Streptacidiphilus fuscans]|uniref:Alpha-galactosidase n=1 Tax=Streptacidiphilus fuscans TaxID=2789292 RepID=A0A931FHY2_9ACTN|nr:NPCBM/NEW2 domain-containing protein [Streptacidiphilus fuscans]MBF9072785.1 NPCBM/NEW2 domain-containing protein [Streptacidiphilus fuscans]
MGYQYVNLDDFYYQCPGGQGPAVDQYGRWVTDPGKFPPSGSEDGIKVVADHVHADGLKFGLYVTPGISQQAVAENTPIEGTSYHADDIAEPSVSEANYNCGGMVGIDYSKPGAQAFIDSWADEMASWGVDYLKIDGVGSWDVPDVAAWSNALRQTGRPIHLELSNGLAVSDASTWATYANGWRTGGDIECYCGTNGSSYPLTSWNSVATRFDEVAAWQPYGGPGAFNDYDSIEVGNGSNDGLTPDERRTQLSLWAMAASPLLLGTDLTHLDPTDLGYLKNTDVIAVDQDGIDAKRIADTSTSQIFTKKEADGDSVVALFNTSDQPQTISTSASAIGMPTGPAYTLDDLWAHQTTETAGTITAQVPAHGTALYRVGIDPRWNLYPPSVNAGIQLDLPYPGATPVVTAGGTNAVQTSVTNTGRVPARGIQVSLSAPAGWSVTPASASSTPALGTNATFDTSWKISVPTTAAPGSYSLTMTERHATGSSSETVDVVVPPAPPTGTVQLATVPWLQETIGWGTLEKNESVGGNPLTIGGVAYPTGIGTHADSLLEYYIGQKCSSVSTTVGVDSEVGTNGSVDFQIWADGKQVADSGVMTGGEPGKALTANVSGAQYLRLVVNHTGDTINYDHSDWADAQITCAS